MTQSLTWPGLSREPSFKPSYQYLVLCVHTIHCEDVQLLSDSPCRALDLCHSSLQSPVSQYYTVFERLQFNRKPHHHPTTLVCTLTDFVNLISKIYHALGNASNIMFQHYINPLHLPPCSLLQKQGEETGQQEHAWRNIFKKRDLTKITTVYITLMRI